MKFIYKSLQIRQTRSSKMIILFSAPATEIDEWVGIPQKKRFGTGEETVGFQREVNSSRVSSLSEFCVNDENILQNPLLCSTKKIPVADCCFVPNEDGAREVQEGNLIINIPDYNSYSLKEIFSFVRDYIENRVPELKGKAFDPQLFTRLKAVAIDQGHFGSQSQADEAPEEIIQAEESANQENESNTEVAAETVLFEESHIIDFWQEIVCRHELLKLLDSTPSEQEFLGFNRSALTSYLKPIVLVDGQHRLRGVLKAAEEKLNREEIQDEIEARITGGESADSVESDILKREVRYLPVSLLLADDPAEQVFQFVVVNQKATPIGRALLGTIISTTLSNDEMEKVASRLKDAGIALEESQAITYLARFPKSPFYNLIERGMTGDSKDLLQWNVFVSIISIFRDLRGGKLFGISKNDYASIWRDKYLFSSGLISGYAEEGYSNDFDYWRRLDGPWRDIFIAFFSRIRDEFGDTQITDAHNYWGKPRESNLFNKISLTILAADFFQYLVETRQTIDTVKAVHSLVDDWLTGVNRGYFNRDWNLSGTKKDSTGIRNQWAYQWSEYRKNPVQLP